MVAVALSGSGDKSTATAYTTTGTTTLTLAKPANVSDGDLLVAFLHNQTAGSAWALLTGWTAVATSTARAAGVYFKAVPSAAAETATSYPFTTTAIGRTVGVLFRVTGASLTTPLDVVGAETSGSANNLTLPTITAANSRPLALAFLWVNAGSALSTVLTNTSGGYADTGLTTTVTGAPTTSSTIDVFSSPLPGPGATGAPVFHGDTATPSGWLLTVASIPSAAFAGAGTLTLTTPPQPSATVAMSGTGTLTARRSGPLDTWLQTTPLYVAHRGGSGNWTEATLYAYTQAAQWNTSMALEVPVWMTPDGVWVASHDQTTGRVFNGTNYDITTTPWATLSALTTKVGNYPPARLDELLNAFPDRAWFVDNKGSQNVTGFFNLLDANGGPSRFVAKQFYTGTIIADAAHARGYKTWGYYYDADTPNIAATQASWDLLGEDLSASAASWAAIKSYGKPVLAHIVSTTAQKTLADTRNPAGYMVAGVQEVVPQTPATGVLNMNLSGTGALTLAGTAQIQDPRATAAMPSPGWNTVALKWAGTYLDGSPCTGSLTLTYNGGVMLDESDTTPLNIYPSKIVLPITTKTITIGGQARTVGYAEVFVPASNDPDVQGTFGSYTLTETLNKGGGRQNASIIADLNAADGTIWLHSKTLGHST